MSHPRVSVAVPVHNEETVVPELVRRVAAVLDGLPGGPHELVIVDDGSTDRTPQLLRQAVGQDPRLTAVLLSRNFGHQAALSAALDHLTGDVAVVMDGDLQDSPEAIPEFLALHRQGYDVVYARRVLRKEPWYLRLAYFAFYRVLSRLSETEIPIDAGDFGLMSRRVVDELRRMPERHRYLRGLRSWVGFRQIGMDVERAERHSGRSKYTFTKLARLATDGLFSFSIVPLRVAAIFGLAAVGASLMFTAYAAYARLVLQQSPAGFTALIWVITFLSGAILLCLGVIGEYLGRVYEQLKARPVYVVSAIVAGEVQPDTPRPRVD